MIRLRALVAKELLDVVRNRAVLLPVAVAALVFIVLPCVIAVLIPAVTGDALGDDAGLARVSLLMGPHENLTTNGRVQLFIFQQFLIVFLLMPVTGAMALAAHAIVGEKQARTLEPLLATPLTTLELLTAKVLGALIPTLAISTLGLVAYGLIIVASAEPGVMTAMLSPRTIVLVLGVGPMCALVSLQMAIVISSRVNDPRTAQQFGVLIVIPVTALVIGQISGSLWLSGRALGFLALGLFGVWILLTLLSVALFERETILTRWR
ncbi:MAG TPA: ABC transporter permease subunit [Vicinamibacterales bacterium]